MWHAGAANQSVEDTIAQLTLQGAHHERQMDTENTRLATIDENHWQESLAAAASTGARVELELEDRRPQNEMATVASLFRDAVQVIPAAEQVDALPAASMVALPDELLRHIFRQACNVLEPPHATCFIGTDI